MPLLPSDRPHIKEKYENSHGLRLRIWGQYLPLPSAVHDDIVIPRYELTFLPLFIWWNVSFFDLAKVAFSFFSPPSLYWQRHQQDQVPKSRGEIHLVICPSVHTPLHQIVCLFQSATQRHFEENQDDATKVVVPSSVILSVWQNVTSKS